MVYRVQDEFKADRHYIIKPTGLEATKGADRFRFPGQFTLTVEVERNPPDSYVRSFTSKPPARRSTDDGGLQMFGAPGGTCREPARTTVGVYSVGRPRPDRRGVLAYPFLYLPNKELKENIRAKQEEIAKDKEHEDLIRKDLPRWEAARKISLPSNQDVARVEYSKRIRDLAVQDCGFSTETTVKMIETGGGAINLPGMKNAKPVVTKLQCKLEGGRVDMQGLTKFLEAFYKMPLLHQIRTLTVSKPTTPAPAA